MDNFVVYIGVLAALTCMSLFLKNFFKSQKQDGLMVTGIKGVIVLVMFLFVSFPITLLFSGTHGRNDFFRPMVAAEEKQRKAYKKQAKEYKAEKERQDTLSAEMQGYFGGKLAVAKAAAAAAAEEDDESSLPGKKIRKFLTTGGISKAVGSVAGALTGGEQDDAAGGTAGGTAGGKGGANS